MERFIGSTSKDDLLAWIDNVVRHLRNSHNIFCSLTSGAVVFGLNGVTKVVNSSMKNVAAFPPLFPAFQGLLNQRIHAGIIDRHAGTVDQYILGITVAAGCPGEPRGRVANLQGSEHHKILVFLRAGTRSDV